MNEGKRLKQSHRGKRIFKSGAGLGFNKPVLHLSGDARSHQFRVGKRKRGVSKGKLSKKVVETKNVDVSLQKKKRLEKRV